MKIEISENLWITFQLGSVLKFVENWNLKYLDFLVDYCLFYQRYQGLLLFILSEVPLGLLD